MIFAYEPHRQVIRDLMLQLGANHNAVNFIYAHDLDRMRGLRSPTFMYVFNHDRPLPPEMFTELRALGAVLITHDDSHARARWGDRRRHVHG